MENSERDGNTRPPYVLLRNLYAGQEATVRTGHGATTGKIGKGVHQGCILSSCLFNLYAEYIKQNAGLDQAGIKIARRNTNNLRYADDTTLMAESEEELKNLLEKVKEENLRATLKLKIQKLRSCILMSYHFMVNRWGKSENMTDFIFLDSKITVDVDGSHEVKTLAPWKKSYDKPRQHITETSLCHQRSG